MGDLLGTGSSAGIFTGQAPLDSVTKGQGVGLRPTLTGPQGEDLIDLAYATSYGKRDRLVKLGIGFAAGVAVSLAVRQLKKRK